MPATDMRALVSRDGIVLPERMASLARTALEAGVAFVLFDWMYHYVAVEHLQLSPAGR